MTQAFEVQPRALMRAHCRHCAHEMVFQPQAGWVVLHPGDSYNNCPENGYGPHEPDLYANGEAANGTY